MDLVDPVTSEREPTGSGSPVRSSRSGSPVVRRCTPGNLRECEGLDGECDVPIGTEHEKPLGFGGAGPLPRGYSLHAEQDDDDGIGRPPPAWIFIRLALAFPTPRPSASSFAPRSGGAGTVCCDTREKPCPGVPPGLRPAKECEIQSVPSLVVLCMENRCTGFTTAALHPNR
ncbi:hypothetical protein DSECCO2_523290 [anaerobic digester metagenome]